MGWSGGSELAYDVWKLVRPLTYEGKDRKKIAKKIIALFESQDCDTMYECEQLCKDAGVKYDD